MSVGRVAALLLGGVLVVSAVAKLATPGSAARGSAGLGVPGWVAGAVAPVELVVGSMLVAGVLPPWAAVVAAALLVAFTVVLVRVLRRGEHPSCACFGGLTAGRVTWWSVARNLALLGLAALATTA